MRNENRPSDSIAVWKASGLERKMNQHDEIVKSARRLARQTSRNNFLLLFVGGLAGALTVLAITNKGPVDWAAAALAALMGISSFVYGYYHQKATGKTAGLTVGSLAAVGSAQLAASYLVTSSSVQVGLLITGLIVMIAVAVLSWRRVWLQKKS